MEWYFSSYYNKFKAFWYTKDRGNLGQTYGNQDRWVGMGIMFDTFNNDNAGSNPQIIAVLNNNTFDFDHDQYYFQIQFTI